MKKTLSIVALLAVCGAGQALASDEAVLFSESVSFTGVESFDALGASGNTTLGHTFTGGFAANSISFSGMLTELETATFASEADIEMIGPAGTFTLGPTSVTSYSGTLAVDTSGVIDPAVDFAGAYTFEFFESFDDASGTADQIWDDLTITFSEVGITNGMFALGAVGVGDTATASGHNVAGGLDFYDFSVGAVGASGSYLNINTSDPVTGDTIDTEIAIFDAAGILVGLDDDGQISALGGLYSMLSFGVDDPTAGDGAPGSDGATLAAGDYTVVVGGFNTNFEDLTIGASHISEVIAGTSAGDYDLSITYVPAPASAAILGLGGIAAIRRRR